MRSRATVMAMSSTALLSANEAAALTLADAAQLSPAGIVSRTVLQAEGLRVVLFAFAEGQELTSHTSRRRPRKHAHAHRRLAGRRRAALPSVGARRRVSR